MKRMNNVEDIIVHTLVNVLKENVIVKYEFNGKSNINDNAIHMHFTATQGDTKGDFVVIAGAESTILPDVDRMESAVKYKVDVPFSSKIYGSTIIKVIKEHVNQAQNVLNQK